MSIHPENLVKVQTVTFKVGDRELVLTPDEARRLRDSLVDFIGPKNGVWPNYTQQPIFIDPNSEQWPDHWETRLIAGGKVDLKINVQ